MYCKIRKMILLTAISCLILLSCFLTENAVAAVNVDLTYRSTPATLGPFKITAKYSEDVRSGETPRISINQPGTVDIINAVMTQGADRRTWTYTYMVNKDNGNQYKDGRAMISLSSVRGISGSIATAPTNSEFIISTIIPTSFFNSISHNQVLSRALDESSSPLEVIDPYTPVKKYNISNYNAVSNHNLFMDGETLIYRLRFYITKEKVDKVGNMQIDFRFNDYNEDGVELSLTKAGLYKEGVNGVLKEYTENNPDPNFSFLKLGKNRYRINIGNDNNGVPMLIANREGKYYIEYQVRLAVGSNSDDIGETSAIIRNNCIIRTAPYGLGGKVIEPGRPAHKTYINTRITRYTAIYR